MTTLPAPRGGRRALALALLLAAGAGCSRDAGDPATLLPAASPAGAVPTGDPAGAAGRGVAAIVNPYAATGDAAAVREGERLYREMNCADCHGYAGEGKMCPSLTDGEWLFGDTPADRFVSIHRGRARGMPAYGALLPDESIWKIVAYIDELGRRASAKPLDRGDGGAAAATREAQGRTGSRR